MALRYRRVHSKAGTSCPALRKGQMAHRILLVEDEAALRSIAARALRGEAYEVTEASDGFEAWGLAKKTRFDLIITDSQMPRLSGSEFVARVRDLHPTLPILRICGSHYYGPQEVAVRTLFKPFTIDELTQIVGSMLVN
jgi:CheY-like chemotaxis protein